MVVVADVAVDMMIIMMMIPKKATHLQDISISGYRKTQYYHYTVLQYNLVHVSTLSGPSSGRK
jgi:hypothetical protein